MRKLPLALCLLFFLFGARAQQILDVAIISDATENENHFFEESIKAEINALLASRFQLRFTEVFTNGNVRTLSSEIANIYANDKADVLIGAGIISSKLLSEQKAYPIPTIASIHLTKATDQILDSSGIPNFTYIKSPFDIRAGIKILMEICQSKKLAVLTGQNLSAIEFNGAGLYADIEKEISWLSLESDLASTVSKLPADIKGVYILSPLTDYSTDEINLFFTQLNERKLPSFTLLDEPMLKQGGYASFASADNLKKIPRRIALNIEKITEGKDPKDFPVNIETFTNQLIINMETVNKVAVYPKWFILDEALLVNINKPNTSRLLNLKSAIAEGIQNNIGYHIEQKETQISTQNVKLAKSNYLPTLEAESTGLFLDENTVSGSFGSKGSFNWTAGASFSQLILSEPAMANIAVQKLLLESQQQVQQQSELDVILEVAQRYFNYRQILALADLQNNNIKAINQNLTIARNKEKVGYSGASDVYRWQTELDLAKSDLYQTNAQLKAVAYQLNETLNRPIKETFAIDKSESINQFIEKQNQTFLKLIENQSTLDRFTDFMVNESRENLPETKQTQLAIAAQERLLKSNKRAFYMPTIAFGANYDYAIGIINPGDPPPIPGFEASSNPTWNAAFNASIPIFAGTSRRLEKEKTQLGLYQLQDRQKELNNLLELQVRANIQQVNASYNNIRLTKSAAEAAGKNINIVQDLYKSGQVNVTTLVDAQNSLLSAQVNATNATFQFMIDYFLLQRSVGDYSFLATDEQNAVLLQRFLTSKSN